MRYHKEDLMSAPTVQINKERTQRENTNMKVKKGILPFLFVVLLAFNQVGSVALATEGGLALGATMGEEAAGASSNEEGSATGEAQGVSDVDDAVNLDDEGSEGTVGAGSDSASEDAEETEGSDAAKGDADATEDIDADGTEDIGESNTGDTEGDLSLLATDITASIDGVYTIAAVVSKDKVYDIPNGSNSNGAKLQIYTANRTPAQRFLIKPVKNDSKYFTIINIQSGKALDVPSSQAKSGVAIQQYSPNGTNAQKWTFVSTGASDGSCYIVSKLNSKLYLDVAGASKANGASLQLYTANKTAAQRFLLHKQTSTVKNGLYVLETKLSSSAVLDIAGGSSANGANVQIHQKNNTFAQKFNVTFDADTGYYTITNVMSKKALDVASAAAWPGANVIMHSSNKTKAQMWAIEADGKEGYVLYAACSGLALDVAGASVRNGTNIQTYTPNKTSAQSWVFRATRVLNDGIYLVKNALGTTLDVAGNATSAGTNIQAYKLNATLAQRFKLTHESGGYYTLECLNSGLLVAAVASTANVQIANATVNDNKLWQPVAVGGGYVALKNKATNTMMDIKDGSTASGANVQVFTSNGTAAQKWNFVATSPLPEGYFTVASALNSDLVFDIPSASRDNGARPQLYSSNETLAQRFSVEAVTGSVYTITAVCSDKAFDVANGSIDASGNGTLQQYTSNGTAAQKWRVEYVGSGQFSIASSLKSSSYITVQGTAASGAPLVIRAQKDSKAQRFIFKPATSTVLVRYSMTLDQMADYQKTGNPYIANVSLATIRNALDPNRISGSLLYQFADLRSYTGLSGAQINAFLGSTTAGREGVLKNYGASFVKASKQYGVNECYLVSHAILETGWGDSDLARGYVYDGKTAIEGKLYPKGTYYNFFGIGANDSSPLSGGRSMAIQNGWDSPEKAILGGAAWIAKYYIYASSYPQPTLYDMKWDVARSNTSHAYGWHQYASDYLWPEKNSTLMNQCYTYNRFTPTLIYLIPKYA
jgi:beta-N-acetylglucosaminidase